MHIDENLYQNVRRAERDDAAGQQSVLEMVQLLELGRGKVNIG